MEHSCLNSISQNSYPPKTSNGTLSRNHLCRSDKGTATVTVLLIIAVIVVVRWDLVVLLICISLTTTDAEHLFVSFVLSHASCISSLEKCLLKSFAHFKNQIAWGFLVELWEFYILWILTPSQVYTDLYRFTHIYSHSVDCLSTLLIMSFGARPILANPVCLPFSCFTCAFSAVSEKKNHC